jgi:hypothetical protein
MAAVFDIAALPSRDDDRRDRAAMASHGMMVWRAVTSGKLGAVCKVRETKARGLLFQSMHLGPGEAERPQRDRAWRGALPALRRGDGVGVRVPASTWLGRRPDQRYDRGRDGESCHNKPK